MHGALRRAAAVVLGSGRKRALVSYAYLHGSGIEIGALHSPLPVQLSAKVRYVDRMSVEDLRRQYPELSDRRLVHVDVIDDGQRLLSVGDASQDFVIANHFLEHAEDPIAAVENAMRVLRPGGVLFMALPDKRYTFDVDRPSTHWGHLLRDQTDGGVGSRCEHFEEWVRCIEKLAGDDVAPRVAQLLEADSSIHFHVWSYPEMLDMILSLRGRIGFEIELAMRNDTEVIFVLRRPPEGA